ncbi:MAG: hypothetical protein COT91_00880 [Candidatus Doudnabacteria bacterium CG10_big_fil_rev_8_21_14_0_10_41_10]|uniref:Uncharacterized protein n=1 Tax=Candidatus Doudnabacteria bacterium CG10_big_fil_rev_8_21_14_0_10_41_10 TaxID=1974551 RepID=A0A2H0VEM7_9BACT|nr:MAG: hypothetical protein COT91_00880 [Candidatus Doudnabacteria bacterium CG10_big_fil_rev_8_21_14_0_10_41_10]
MNIDNEHWEQLKENLNGKFEIIEDTTEDLMMDTGEGEIKSGEQNVLIVKTPMGEIKVVREVKPKVLDKKTIFSHRQGQSAQTEYKFSATEKTYKLRLYKQDDMGEWQELNEESLKGMI